MHELPSRYGMLTSKTAESFNSMIDKYHNDQWIECVDAILQHVTKSISDHHQTFQKTEDPTCQNDLNMTQ